MTISAFLADRLRLAGTTPASLSQARWRTSLELRLHQTVATLILLALSPLLLGVALWIMLSEGGPVFYGHFRVGQDGRMFRCLKFRTMCLDAEVALQRVLASDPTAHAEWARDHKLENDPRITPIGRLLRRTSLDELPQLLNVLRGDMLLVGPRPITAEELARYGATRWHYLSVRPGITGLWQVNGRNRLSYEERVALDRHYVERRNLWLDIGILWCTVAAVLQGDGAK